MRVLVTNDDGVDSPGIAALARAVADLGHDVVVAAPAEQSSGTSASIISEGAPGTTPVRPATVPGLSGLATHAVSASPAHIVLAAVRGWLDPLPDLVLSGINHGPNLGTDVFCSGTVAAAMEGTLERRPAMAVSSACFKWRDFEGAAQIAVDAAESALREGWPENLLLNLNLPPCKAETMGPMRWTRLSIRRYDEQFSPRKDPQGRTYYWLAGEVVEDLESGGDGPRDWPTDVAQIEANAPSLTPIQPELFWRGSLGSLPQLELGGQRVR